MLGWILRRAGMTVLLVVAVSATWWTLGRMDDEVPWLTMEAPAAATGGELLKFRVRVTGLEKPSQLVMDLNGSRERHGPNDFLAPGGAKPVSNEGGQFDFEFQVPHRTDLRFVNAILFLSPSGDWKDHTFVATTELIPLTHQPPTNSSPMVETRVRVMSQARPAEISVQGQFLQRVCGAIWLAASLIVCLRWKQSGRIGWLLAIAFAAAGAWELLDLETQLGALARLLARTGDLYDPREGFQKLMISLTVGGIVVLALWLLRKRSLNRWMAFVFLIYLGVALVNFLSLHSIDSYLARSWQGMPILDVIKTVCAVVVGSFLLLARPNER